MRMGGQWAKCRSKVEHPKITAQQLSNTKLNHIKQLHGDQILRLLYWIVILFTVSYS